jgi:hypothetical protein
MQKTTGKSTKEKFVHDYSTLRGKIKASKYSQGHISKILGFNSENYLSNILTEGRSLKPQYIEMLTEMLEIGKEEFMDIFFTKK